MPSTSIANVQAEPRLNSIPVTFEQANQGVASWPATWLPAASLISSRRNASPRRLTAPAPTTEQLNAILLLAGAAPDHGHLTPWRFVIIPNEKRTLLAEAFALALVERDPGSTLAQMEAAREKAYRSPLLMIAIARLADLADEISTAERLVSLGAALQNLLLGAQALGYGAGLTSGKGITSRAIRALFNTASNEEPVCFVSIGTPGGLRGPRLRPQVETFTTTL